jgi:hypothetical protein
MPLHTIGYRRVGHLSSEGRLNTIQRFKKGKLNKKWISLSQAKDIAREFGILDSLASLWTWLQDIEEGHLHDIVNCGHCFSSLQLTVCRFKHAETNVEHVGCTGLVGRCPDDEHLCMACELVFFTKSAWEKHQAEH